ncbi:NKF protein [Mycobacterium phage RitSun]|nr:NKF protein [Mycobacterium phage RitSun]
MNLVERLNARFNNVIHDGLALVGAVVDPWLARLERQAMSNALGRDISMDYGDVLVAVEAEEEVHEPSVGHRVSAGQSSATAGDIGPGAGMVPPPPAPGPSNPLNTYVAGPLGEAIPGDEFMELGEFLDTATAEELAAMRQQREVSEGDLTMRIAEARYTWPHSKAAESSSHYIAKYLLENYRITPK